MPVIALCMPIRDALHHATFRSIMRARIPRPYHLLDVIDHPVESARNLISARGVGISEITHFMWIDDDMVFEPDAIERLLAHDRPVVGGLCHNRRPPYMPILIRQMTHGEHAGKLAFMYDYEPGLCRVDATGGAFLLVKREVMEKIGSTLKEGEGHWTVDGAGEDISFCNRVTKAGFEIVVDTTVEIGHVGEVIVTPKFAHRNRDGKLNPWRPW